MQDTTDKIAQVAETASHSNLLGYLTWAISGLCAVIATLAGVVKKQDNTTIQTLQNEKQDIIESFEERCSKLENDVDECQQDREAIRAKQAETDKEVAVLRERLDGMNAGNN